MVDMSDYPNYIKPSEQFRECTSYGTAYHEKCLWCGQEMILCKKYGGICSSGKCKKARMNGEVINS